MAILKRGTSGEEVRKLQRELMLAGFNPGAVDGKFGGGTEAAVMAFQQSKGLLADGVAGPRTFAALELDEIDALPDITGSVSVEAVSHMFPGAPIRNIRDNLPPVLDALGAEELTDRSMVLCALATIRAETAGFAPIREFVSRFNTSPNGHDFDLYDHRDDLGNQGPPDGARFCGRGFIQLTGRHNYQRYGERIGLGDGLIENPDRANEPEIAARLLAAFIADKEIAIKDCLLRGDLRGARRLVNGGSHGLDAFTDAYRTGEQVLPSTGEEGEEEEPVA